MTGISIIIPNFHSTAENLDRTLSAFFETNTYSPVELIVLDHANPAQTRETIARYATRGFIRHIKASDPYPSDMLTEHAFESFKKANHQHLLYLFDNTSLTPDLLLKTADKIKSPENSIVGIIQKDAGQQPGMPDTAGFLFRKNKFPTLEKLIEKCRNGFDSHINLHPKNIQADITPSDLNILFVSHSRMSTNSGYHVQYYANMAAHQGASVIVAAPKIDDNEQFMYDSFRIQTYKEIEENGISYPDARSPDIVHAWSPREKVRKFCSSLANRYSFKTVIHMEDNEEHLTENATGRTFEDLSALSAEKLDQLIPQNRFHPLHGWQWLKQADGLTMIIDTLQRFNPNSHPSLILPAPVDERLFYPRPINYELRKKLNIPDNHIALAYIGNVRSLKRQEASELYQAVILLNEQGISTTLIRTGENFVSLNVEKEKYKQFEKSLGWVERTQIPDILAAADILVQPGRPGPFDDQRVPAKLPEYFAMGRPIILPRANLGLLAEHGREGYVLEKADAEGIAGAVTKISRNNKLRARLAMGAAGFFKTGLQNKRVYNELKSLYSSMLTQQ